MKRLIILNCLLNFCFLAGNGQEVVENERVPLSMDQVADFGHCYVALEGGGKWHSIRSCWILKRADAKAVKHLPFTKTRELGEGKKWNSHCQVCQENLQAAIIAEDFRGAEEKGKLLAFVNSSEQPPNEPVLLVSSPAAAEPEVDVEEQLTAEPKAAPLDAAVKIPVVPEAIPNSGGITIEGSQLSTSTGRVKIPSLSRQLHPRKDRQISKSVSCRNGRTCRSGRCLCR